MFELLEVCLQYLEKVTPIEDKIRKRSAGLAKQLSEAGDSMTLNSGEGRARRGGDQRYHDTVAAGSAGEATVALRMSVARGYVTKDELVEVDALLDRARAMLYRMTH